MSVCYMKYRGNSIKNIFTNGVSNGLQIGALLYPQVLIQAEENYNYTLSCLLNF